MAVLQQIWLYKIIGGMLLMCQNTTVRVYGHGLEHIAFNVKKYIAALVMCYNPALVHDKPLGAPAYVELVYLLGGYGAFMNLCMSERRGNCDIFMWRSILKYVLMIEVFHKITLLYLPCNETYIRLNASAKRVFIKYNNNRRRWGHRVS